MKKLYNFLKFKLCYRTYWKQWLALLAICFLIFTCSGGGDKNTLTELNLKGKVKSINTAYFTATEKFGEAAKDDSLLNEEQKFDDKGNQIEKASYDENGELSWKNKFNYDDKGNQIEEAKYNKDGELDYTITNEFEYDRKNNWIKKIKYKDDKPTYISEREIEYYD